MQVYLTDTHLVGEWRSDVPAKNLYEVYKREHSITFEYWGNYIRHNMIHRRVYNLNGDLIDDEFVAENHALMMYEPFLEYKQTKNEIKKAE